MLQGGLKAVAGTALSAVTELDIVVTEGGNESVRERERDRECWRERERERQRERQRQRVRERERG